MVLLLKVPDECRDKESVDKEEEEDDDDDEEDDEVEDGNNDENTDEDEEELFSKLVSPSKIRFHDVLEPLLVCSAAACFCSPEFWKELTAVNSALLALLEEDEELEDDEDEEEPEERSISCGILEKG